MGNRLRFVAKLGFLAMAAYAAAWIPAGLSAHLLHGSAPYRTLIVGGGPDLKHNQVAIESNVRYVSRLLPTGAKARVLYTDGNPQSKNVLYQDADKQPAYRAPEISRIDGPSDLGQIRTELATISDAVTSNPSGPVFLYFTGHGSPNPIIRGDGANSYQNNNYDLWDSKHLTVKDLAASLKTFPKQTPISLVMVECFSGAFGNLLFADGDPNGQLADLNICGFFASVAQREAAGCTSEVNEANYKDFTSYFFAALTGVDRLGNRVTGADYNHDGKVGMNEAYAYSLIHDDSIDTPVCTSDVFLRRFVNMPIEETMATPYHLVQSWADPAQLAAMDALSKAINMTDDDCLQKAYKEYAASDANSMELNDVRTLRFVRLSRSVVLAHKLLTSSDETLRARFSALVKLEGGNPLR